MTYQVINGNNIEVLKTFPDNHFDSIVTDPPYGIDFLGKEWDANTGALETYQECLRVLKPGGHILAFSAARTYHHLAMSVELAGFEIRDQIMWIYSSGFPKSRNIGDGYGTALKPAHEPIVMARKPIEKTVMNNVLKYGTGAINIDACRVGNEQRTVPVPSADDRVDNTMFKLNSKIHHKREATTLGRFPTNVLGEIDGYQKYFYCPKVNTKERGDYNNHPTVKPVELMKYLVNLVTPKGGTVLDPFNGSGSTGMACVELNFNYVGIDLDSNYVDISVKRIEAHSNKHKISELFVIE
jgi:site-specific DNA-methyltransferase (adenine-specific)